MPEQGNQSQTSPEGNGDQPTDRRVTGEGQSEPQDSHRKQSSSWNQSAVFRFIGMGTELAGFTLFVAGVVYVIDSFSESPKPYGTAFGALIGFTLGMVRFIRQARQSQD